MKKALLLFLLLLSCGKNGTDESTVYSGGNTEPPPEDVIVTFEQLNEKVLTSGRCLTCHGDWPGESEEAKILSRVSDRGYEESPLYKRTADGSMPPGGPPLSDNQLEYIRSFIEGLDTD